MKLQLKTLDVIKITVFAFSSVICLVLLLLSGGLFTHLGNQLVIKIAEQIEPRLSVELEQGSFFYSPTFSNLRWIDQHTEIQIASVSYQFDWSCLFNKICLQRLDINDAQLTLESSSAENKGKSPAAQSPVFELPMDVELHAINLKNIHFSFGDIKADLNTLHLQGEGEKKDLTIKSVINGLSVSLPAQAKTPSTNPVTFPALLSQQDLPEIVLPINLHLSPFKVTHFTLNQGKEQVLKVNAFQIQADFIHSILTVHALDLDLPETDLQLSGEIAFTGNYPLALQLQGQLKAIKQLQPEQLLLGQRYQLKTYGNLSALKTELLLSNKISMQLSAQIDLLQKDLPYKLMLNWQQLRWPLTGDVQYSSAKGALKSSGTVDNYQLQLNSDYHAENMPSGKFTLNGKGSLQQFNLEQLLIKTLDGSVDLNGLLRWQNAITWDGQLRIDKIDLAQLKTPYSGNFSGEIKQKLQFPLSQLDAPKWMLNIPQINIHGQFLQRPFAITGGISADNQKGIVFQDVIIKNAENKFIVKGLLAEQNDLDIKVDIADLGHALLDSSGSVHGEVKIEGPKQAIRVKSRLQGALLSYQTTRLNAFKLKSEALLSDKPALSLQLYAEKLKVAKQNIDAVEIRIKKTGHSATTQTHQIDLSVKSKQLTTELQIAVMQKKDAWISALNGATFYLPSQQLTLEKPFHVVLKDNKVLIAPHCWNLSSVNYAHAGKLCVKNLMLGQQGQVDFVIDSYLLENLDPFLPATLKMRGAVAADGRIKWGETARPSFDLNVSAQEMGLRVNQGKTAGSDAVYPIKTFKLKLVSRKQKSDLSVNIYAKNLIAAKIQGQLFPYKKDPVINATANIELLDFSPFSAIIPEIEKLSGHSQIKLTVKGPLSKAVINGHINITDTNLSAVTMPVQIAQLNSAIMIKNNQATVAGSFYSAESSDAREAETRKTIINQAVSLVDKSIKEVRKVIINEKERRDPLVSAEDEQDLGKVEIKGSLDWRNKLKGDIHLFANKMLINDYDKIYLLVSPDLHLKFADKIVLNGKVEVNKGKITVKELPENAVSTSKDVIVIDRKTDKAASMLPIDMQLQVDLGQQLKVIALGLNTTIKGNLLIRKALDKNPSVIGELKLIDGSYKAFSQQLVLQESRITFQGPAESPYISIEAIRDPEQIEDNVTAGVRVTGTPDQLSLVIFSDPAMAQQDALSYILRGKSMQSSTDSVGNSQIAGMLISLGADKSANVINELGNSIGIKDLALSSSGSGDMQSVGVSGSIAPGVELSYGVGVFDSFSILAIRYEMFERFYIEASSGLEQAIDAYYEFDWD